MIELQNITKVYLTDTIETTALAKVSLSISRGDMLAIMGPSGSGKSTLLNILGLLDRPSSGIFNFDGKAVFEESERKLASIRNRKIGFIFQNFHLIPDLTVIDNVALPLLYRMIKSRERKRLSLEALEKVGLSARTKHFPSQLSGGQMQRVAIARAIVGEPEILLADEPTGNLDSVMGNEIMSIIESLNRSANTTVIMVTHDERMAERTHRIVRLFDGNLVFEEAA